MLLKVAPVVECVEAVQSQCSSPGHVILFTPQGRRLSQAAVEQLAERTRLLLICGRYEGFDQRVMDILQPDQLSIGDYVVSGGEVAAMVVIDAVTRLIPGVLGDATSSQQDSFSQPERLLEFAQYTRPRDFRGHRVPEVLLSGNHPEIARWRREQSLDRSARHADRPQE
jgi:tRNA (guanine37-N1)-methyltransferase